MISPAFPTWTSPCGRATIHHGDCLDVMRSMPDGSVDAVVTDPPYGLAFMGKSWDSFAPGDSPMRRTAERDAVNTGASRQGGRQRACADYAKRQARDMRAFQESMESWAIEALRVAKPGAHLLAFGGTRTFHRLTCAIEDAGWEIRDCLSWLYGSGFPKSHDVSKAMDKGGVGCGWFIDYCIEVAAERGITKKQLSSLFPSKNGNATGWLYNKASHNQDLTPAQFNALRDFLNLPFPDISSAKREVVGRRTSGLTAGTIANFNGEREFDVTAPATDMARKWYGWGTALKPAWEPVIMARKPLIGTVAANVSAHGTGALNIDGCRIATTDAYSYPNGPGGHVAPTSLGMRKDGTSSLRRETPVESNPLGRWPANVLLDEDAAAALDEQSGVSTSNDPGTTHVNDPYFGLKGERRNAGYDGDFGGASRFFYTSKASRAERNAGLDGFPEEMPDNAVDRAAARAGLEGRGRGRGSLSKPRANIHPTVKPVDLMRWLVRLVTPHGATVLDPFLGSGTTLVAALQEGCRAIGIEREAQYVEIAKARVAHESKQGSLFA